MVSTAFIPSDPSVTPIKRIDLPDDLWTKIMSSLPLSSLIGFLGTSKAMGQMLKKSFYLDSIQPEIKAVILNSNTELRSETLKNLAGYYETKGDYEKVLKIALNIGNDDIQYEILRCLTFIYCNSNTNALIINGIINHIPNETQRNELCFLASNYCKNQGKESIALGILDYISDSDLKDQYTNEIFFAHPEFTMF